MNMLMGMMQGDTMGNGMGDMMNQETQDVIIKMKSPGQKVQVTQEIKYAEMML